MKKLYILTGPTGVGKTELSLEWAVANDAEILSCDSTLFYKGMDIGTAKPREEEMEGVVHHGVDLVSVNEQYDISRYLEYAKGVIEEVHGRGKQVLIVGGSGFYLKGFMGPVVDGFVVSAEVEQRVMDLYEDEGLGGLVKSFMEVNPEGVGDIDLNNPRRVMKALGRCWATGKGYVELKEGFESGGGEFDRYEKDVVILEREKEVLKRRVEERVYKMLSMGLIEEVRGLLEEGIMENPSGRSAIGYREVVAWIREGCADEEELAQKIILDTNRLVAKQRKWFRTQIKGARTINLDEHPDLSYKDLF